LQTNRWEIYNAITDVASHLDLTHNTRDYLERQAEKHVLMAKELRLAQPIPVVA